jgi:peptidoglycan/LPS O-acetylase OafA/YrhL
MRNLSIDRARTFLTLVVLLYHAVLPYTWFGFTGPANWIGFDMIALGCDSFFMAMFFFLSGLFVWQGLGRKGALPYLRERLLRLGLPFAIGALLLIPAGYYAPALRDTPHLTFEAYWWKTVTAGPWPSGPIWFLWVLLAFDLMASVLYRISPRFVVPVSRISRSGFNKPVRFWFFLFAVSAIGYLPPMFYFGTGHWTEFGPFSVQTSRILLYASYFLIGAGVGCAGFAAGILDAGGELPRRRWTWLFVAPLPYSGMWFMIYIKNVILGNPPALPWWYHLAYGNFFVLFSASILLAILAFFLHSNSRARSFLDGMQGEAYGMFLVHYPIVLWIQYFLFESNWPAIAKGTAAFLLTVFLSWAATAAVRKVPGVKRVL